MSRFLERLDGVASTLVPLLYLAGLALGATAYFAGVTLDAGLAVGVALACAAELHSFLQQRRLRFAFAHWQRLADDAPERDALWLQVKVNAAILAALLIFSGYNAIAFAAETWRPAPGFLPAWSQIGLRGLVIPTFFFLAGFLAPLHTDASDQLRATSTDMLRRTLKAIGKQWKQRLAEAQKKHADLAPIAIALLQDAGDLDGARRVELIAAGLGAAEKPATPAVVESSADVSAERAIEAVRRELALANYPPAIELPAPEYTPEPPDDDGGSPQSSSHAVASKPAIATTATNVTPLRRGLGKPPRRDKRTASRANARSGRRGTAEKRIRAALASNPTMSFEELVTRAGVSESTASKWLAVIEAERGQAQAQEMRA